MVLANGDTNPQAQRSNTGFSKVVRGAVGGSDISDLDVVDIVVVVIITVVIVAFRARSPIPK